MENMVLPRSVTSRSMLFNFEGSLQENCIDPKTLWGCSSAGRAPALQAGGQGFESPHLHQGLTKVE